MDFFSLLAVAHLILIWYFLTRNPELIIAVQLLGVPIIGLGLTAVVPGVGGVFFILAATFYALLVSYFRKELVNPLPGTSAEFAIILLVVWIVITSVYTPSPVYGGVKVMWALSIALPCVLVTRVYCDTPEKLFKAFQCCGYYALFLVAFFALYIAMNYSTASGRVKSVFFGPLSLGYTTASAIPFLFVCLVSSKSALQKILAVSAMTASVYVLMSTGSRGPFFGICLAVVFAFFSLRNFTKVLAGGLIVGLSLFAYVDYALENEHKGVERIVTQTEGGDKSTEGRYYLYNYSIEQFLDYPIFGNGIGSFSSYVQERDTRLYPHNTILEIAGELGLVGLSIYVFVMYACLRQIVKLRASESSSNGVYFWTVASIQVLFLVGLMNSIASYEMPLQRTLFVGVGVLAGTIHWFKTTP